METKFPSIIVMHWIQSDIVFVQKIEALPFCSYEQSFRKQIKQLKNVNHTVIRSLRMVRFDDAVVDIA